MAYFIWQSCGSKVRHKRLGITALDIAANLSVIFFFFNVLQSLTQKTCVYTHTPENLITQDTLPTDWKNPQAETCQ